MAERKSSRGGPSDSERFREFAWALIFVSRQIAQVEAKVDHINAHQHHLEKLILANVGPSVDPKQLADLKAAWKAVKDELAQATAKNTALTEAHVPASLQPGTPPQG